VKLVHFAAMAILGFCTAVSAVADQEPSLHKGISLSNWLANAERQPLDEPDFRQIKEAGFDNVRLPVKPELLSGDFRSVDNAVHLAICNGLTTILDLHPRESYKQELENRPAKEKDLITLWINVARHYRNIPSENIVFELLNEPQYYDHEDEYNRLITGLVNAIRQVEPNRWLIVGAPRGSSLEGLLKLRPVKDNHIIYSFHFYEPVLITHQGVHRGFDRLMLRYFHDVPYPAQKVKQDAAFYADTAPSMQQAQDELDAYIRAGWNKDHVRERLQIARGWADSHKVSILCGEFGVLRNHIDSASRYRWIKDAREVLEEEHIGWQLWDYTDLDGITQLEGKTRTDPIDGSVKLADPVKGKRVIEDEALKALGLK